MTSAVLSHGNPRLASYITGIVNTGLDEFGSTLKMEPRYDHVIDVESKFSNQYCITKTFFVCGQTSFSV